MRPGGFVLALLIAWPAVHAGSAVGHHEAGAVRTSWASAVGVGDTTTTTTADPTTTSTIAPATSTTAVPGTSTSVVAATTTTTTDPGGTTTTTTPDHELCGNCRDDDGDGRTDYADPDCCTGPALGFSLTRGRLAPAAAASALKLRGVLSAMDGAGPATHDVALQIDGGGLATPFCAAIADGRFTARGRRYAFADPGGTVAEAGGLDKVTVKMIPSGAKVKLRGKRAALAMPQPGRLEVTVALRDQDGARCGAAAGTFRARGPKLRFP